MQRFLPYLAGLGFATIFGFSFMFTRGALEHISPFHLLGLRFALAALILFSLSLLGLIRFRVGLNDVKALLPLAIFQPLLYFAFETVGVQLTSASHAGMMIAVIPIFVTIFSTLFLKERPAPIQLPFILSSVGGVVIIIALQNGTGETSQAGSFLLLGAVISAACYNIASRLASLKYNPLQTTWVMMLTGALTFNAIALTQHTVAGNLHSYFAPLAQVWPAVLYLGILSSVVAFFLINFCLSRITATQSSVFANLTTVIAITAGVLLRGEAFYWYQGVGAAIILAGVWGTNHFAPREHQRSEPVTLEA
jgi:drug/metabolite transporter (DMT)-like permease